MCGEHGLNQIFKIKRNRWFHARVCRSLGVRHGPLSVHPVKGLSAAGVGVESEGSSRVQAASQECLSECARTVGCGAAGEGAKERQRWCLCSCHLHASLSPKKITFFSFKLALNLGPWLDSCQENTGPGARFLLTFEGGQSVFNKKDFCTWICDLKF